MKVYVNDIEVEIFNGGRAKEAIQKYLSKTNQSSDKSDKVILDQWGNEIADDSPLHDGSRIYFK